MKYIKTYSLFENAEYLSEDENKSIKLIYKFLRDVLLDFKSQISIYYQKNPGNLSISEFIKKHYKPYQNIKLSSEPATLLTDFDQINPIIKKSFKSLQKDFFIRLIPKSEGAAIKSKNDPIRTEGIEIGTTKLFNYPVDALKSSLQHEVQHIANIEKEGFKSGEDEGYSYLASKKEVDSHAKQFAYLYSKKYPGETKMDLKKLREIDMVERSKEKLNLYLWFMSPDEFRKRHKDMSDELYQKIKAAGTEFPQKLKYYLGLYNK